MHYRKGDSIGEYQVAFPQGSSASAEHYRVTHGERTLFLKLVPHAQLAPHQVSDSGELLEVTIARGLEHPNLCRLLDNGVVRLSAGGMASFLVYEFVPSVRLSEWMVDNERPPMHAIRAVGRAILRALSYLHTRPRPIVHSFVTPANILVDLMREEDLSCVRLVGFGGARYLDGKLIKVDPKEAALPYLAPERAAGVMEVASDIYSVGALLYQLIYGKLPWLCTTAGAGPEGRLRSLETQRAKPLPLPERGLYEIDDQLRNVLRRALAQRPEARFESADSFLDALEGRVEVSPPSAPASGEGRRVAPLPKGTGFAAVAGMEELKQQMIEEVIEPMRNPEEYQRYGITIPNGMLLYGPPGCGKTFFVKHFAEELRREVVLATPASLKSKYINATQENIKQLFDEARAKAPIVIFIDEIDDLLRVRQDDDKNMSGVNEFLAQMDRTGDEGIFVIGASNRPGLIDPAILRAGRFERKYYIGLPDAASREALFRLNLKDRPSALALDYTQLAEMTEGYISADITLIVDDAARAAMREKCNIELRHIQSAIQRNRPSVSAAEVARYEKMRAQMESEKPNRPPIGFRRDK